MPIANDSSVVDPTVRGNGVTPIYSVPGSDLIPTAIDPTQALNLLELDTTNLIDNALDDVRGPRRRAPSLVDYGSAFLDVNAWFMEQFWIFERPVDFGNIITDKTITVEILNTFRDGERSVTDLDETDLGNLGITVTAGPDRPARIRFLEQLAFDLTADSEGAPAFDRLAQWTFDGGVVVNIQFIGSRVVLFYFPPQGGVRESLSWVTDIDRARDGTEQRQSLRTAPRQRIQMTFLLGDDAEGSELRNYILALQALVFGVPEWWDQREVTAAASTGSTTIACSPADADFSVDGAAMIFTPDRQAIDVTITAISASDVTLEQPLAQDVPLGSVIVPIRVAYMIRDPNYNDPPVNARETTIVFETTDSSDVAFSEAELTASSFLRHPTDSRPVLVDDNILSGNRLTGGSKFAKAVIDNDFGRRVQYPTGPIGNPMTPKIAALDDVESVWAWRQLLGYLRGSWRSFYLPTFQKDLPVVTSLDLGSTSFQVEFVAAARYIGTNTPRRDILIRLADGRQYVRRITSVADNGDGTETVQLATAPEGAAEVIQAADVMVSYATLVRIEGDAATFEHERPGAASLRFVTTGVKN